ncbi:MAG: hypothetical protein IJM69_08665, partial [Firmicutes bacterium]|nr:hypothetical protein [Bacillota bacterium]
MRKKLFSLVLIFLMLFAYMPQMAAVAYADDTYEGTAYISLSDDGKFVVSDGVNSDVVMAHLAIPLQEIANVDLAEWDLEQYSYTDYNTGDPDPDAPTVLKLYLYLLKHYYGSAGDGEALRASGAPHSFFMEHFWGHDCNLLYYVNGQYPLFESGWGATADGIILHDGDFVDVAMYTDWGFYSDSNAGFNYFVKSDSEPEDGQITFEYNAEAGTPLTVKVARGMGDVNVGQNTAYQAAEDLNLHYGSEVDVNDESDLFLVDGEAQITFDEAGTYYVWVDGGLGDNSGKPCSCPAVAKVNVEAAASTEALSIYNATDDVKLEVSEVVGWNPAYCVENNVFPTYITELERGKDLRIVENPQILKREDTSWGGIQVATPNGYDGSYLDGFAAIDAIDGCDFRAQAGDLARYIHKASEFAILFGDETACLPAYPGNQDDEILLLKVDDAITDEQAAYYDEVEWENSAWTYYIFVKIADPPAPANNAPALAEGVAATAESEATAGEAYTLDLSTIFTDVDGDELTYTVSVNEGEAVAAAASYSYTPEAAGTYTLVFKANDGKADSEDTYTVTLTAA